MALVAMSLTVTLKVIVMTEHAHTGTTTSSRWCATYGPACPHSWRVAPSAYQHTAAPRHALHLVQGSRVLGFRVEYQHVPQVRIRYRSAQARTPSSVGLLGLGFRVEYQHMPQMHISICPEYISAYARMHFSI